MSKSTQMANNVQFIQDMFEVTHNFTIVDHDADVKFSIHKFRWRRGARRDRTFAPSDDSVAPEVS